MCLFYRTCVSFVVRVSLLSYVCLFCRTCVSFVVRVSLLSYVCLFCCTCVSFVVRVSLLFRNASFVSKEQLLLVHYSTFSLSSYCDMNTFCCSQYQSNNKGIPSHLHDRPQEFVLHCLKRRKIALGSDLSEITCQWKGLFTVVSFTNKLSKCYKVYFGSEHEMPKCSCYDWCKTGCFCKMQLL